MGRNERAFGPGRARHSRAIGRRPLRSSKEAAHPRRHALHARRCIGTREASGTATDARSYDA